MTQKLSTFSVATGLNTATDFIIATQWSPNTSSYVDVRVSFPVLASVTPYVINPGQVLDAAAPVFALISGASIGGFLAAEVSDPSAGDGTYTAVFVYTTAPKNGRLWTMLSTYLQSLGLTPTQAATQLNAIWTAASAIIP